MPTKSTSKKKRNKVFIFLIIMLLAIGGGIFYSNNKIQHQSKPHIQLTAVGDSLTQGVGDDTNKGGYVGLIRQKINRSNKDEMVTDNYGIAGETTAQITQRVQHNSKVRNSLKKADVITITTGGNDLIGFFKNHPTDTGNQLSRNLNQNNLKFEQHESQLLGEIRKLNVNAKIYVFGIYNPLYVYFPQVKNISKAVNQLNLTSEKVVKQPKDAYFISINKQLSHGQFNSSVEQQKLEKESRNMNNANMLNSKSVSDIFSGSGKEINRYISNQDHFHPNNKGYQIMTNDLYQEMKQHENWLKE